MMKKKKFGLGTFSMERADDDETATIRGLGIGDYGVSLI